MTTASTKLNFKMQADAMYFVPLGGCGMFGANMSLYGYQDQWIMVDCGMGFADDTMPGVEILLPDPTFAESLGNKLLGVVFTHAHEDHIGAVRSLWPRLKRPMYATRFTAERIKQAVSENAWGNEVTVTVVPDRGLIELGPFKVQFIQMAHSIPEGNSLAITVDAVGTLLHTGDWKLDPEPIVGHKTDASALQKLGDAGVLAVMGDSTNAMVPGHSGSEGGLAKNLAEVFSEFKNAAIAVTCFATNVARLHNIYTAAKANNRQVCLLGRSLWSIDDAARKAGYLKDLPPFLTDDEADLKPAESIIYICTGSQGEPRAALSRIANEDHRALILQENDVVIFSALAIPGNERAIDRIKNRFYAKGVHVITNKDAPVHVSGHPYRDELKQLYAWVRPKVAIPVHGEEMQMEKHAALALECGVPETLIPVNGKVIEISKDGARMVGEVKSGILAIEGKRIVAVDHEAILTRRRMMWNGSAIVTVVVDADGSLMADPKITALGLLDEESEHDQKILKGVIKSIRQKIDDMPKPQRRNDDELSEMVRVTTRRFFHEQFDRKPQTRVHLVRI